MYVYITVNTFSNITQNNKVADDIIDAFNLLPNKSKTNKLTLTYFDGCR